MAISYSTDFEKALYIALEEIFPKIRRIGCYFHFSYNLGKKLKNIIYLKKNTVKKFLKIYYQYLLKLKIMKILLMKYF